MTFKEHLFNLPNEVFAEFLIQTNEYQCANYYCQYNYNTTDDKCFTNYKSALNHQIELLNSKYE